MKTKILSRRYAKAGFELGQEGKTGSVLFEELRALSEAVAQSKELATFFSSPIVSSANQLAAFDKAAEKIAFSPITKSFVTALINKGRMPLLASIVTSLQELSDNANGVSRGTVRSAAALGPAERQRLEQTVERVVGRKVILTYKTEPGLIGGVSAEVGSLVIDDSVFSHLDRLTDHLNRRAH